MERGSVNLVTGYTLILPTIIFVGWIVSWWRPRYIRLLLLMAALVISVLCVIVAFVDFLQAPKPQPVSTQDCSWALACGTDDLSPMVSWAASGLLGIVCSVVLMAVTGVAEVIFWFGRRNSVPPPAEPASHL